MKTTAIIIIYLFVLFEFDLYAQDTIIYEGILQKSFLIETYELYPDSTFKWTNEYDLIWSEYGKYEIDSNKLVFKHFIFSDYPRTMTLPDSISLTIQPKEIKTYEIEQNRIYPLNEKGKRITKMKNSFFKRKCGWLLGNRLDYEVKKIE